MSKLTKNQKTVLAKYDKSKVYSLQEACALLKEITYTKFDASVEITTNLGVDPRKANQMIRGVVTLPNGTGKIIRVLVLCTPDKENEAKEAGADYVGLDEYITKIKEGWTDVDVIICTPSVMAKVGQIGRILGPRGLMPNPKTGTVTMEVGNAVKEVKAGKIDFKVDKTGIIHAARRERQDVRERRAQAQAPVPQGHLFQGRDPVHDHEPGRQVGSEGVYRRIIEGRKRI